jgi:hypothetical protein
MSYLKGGKAERRLLRRGRRLRQRVLAQLRHKWQFGRLVHGWGIGVARAPLFCALPSTVTRELVTRELASTQGKLFQQRVEGQPVFASDCIYECLINEIKSVVSKSDQRILATIL